MPQSPTDKNDRPPAQPLSLNEISRYSRHLLIPEIGVGGQTRLKGSSVLIVGAGGLGSPAAMYLAAAGTGRIGIADADVVDLTNLQRQLLHDTSDVGRQKVDSAAATLRAINPEIIIETHPVRLTSRNTAEILKRYDVVIDGSDNFPTRYLLNDAAFFLGKPLIYGSVFRFEGQISLFHPKSGGPCYRCLFPEPPPPGLVPGCSEGGVLGVLPGVIGTLQALEAVKFITGTGTSLAGRMLVFDGLGMSFRELALTPDPACPLCGAAPSVHDLIDYDDFCGLSPGGLQGGGRDSITVESLKERIDRGEKPFILDVREPAEFDICNLGGMLVPQRDLPLRVSGLNRTAEIVVVCKMGERSARAAEFLRSAGFTNVKNLAGGIDAWRERIDPTLPVY
ncbi:MAG TPA: molybdopterin-synthase adenylyltransferase MoeB [Bacteroidota bacterium]|nr:molybdopterin-synthase adenylyltransferase MoeB [Bacteroidota bacterium]